MIKKEKLKCFDCKHFWSLPGGFNIPTLSGGRLNNCSIKPNVTRKCEYYESKKVKESGED
jgi:hypothetical protein